VKQPVNSDHPPAAGRRRRISPEWLVLPAVIVACAVPWLDLNATIVREVVLTAIFTLIVSGLNLSYGWAGELSFAQPAIFAVGAYSTALLSTHGFNDLLLNLVVGGLLAAIIGTIIGVPGLRLGSWSLAMVSFFLVLLIPDLVTIFQSQTGGDAGFSDIPLPELAGVQLASQPFFVACVLVCTAWLLFYRNLVRSRHGAAMRIMATNAVLAESAGIRVTRLKLVCYLLGSVPAGLAGVLYAYLDGYISPADFGFTVGIGILAASVLGGTRSVYAVVVGTALLQVIPLESATFSDYSILIYGGLLLLGGLVLRGGIAEVSARLTGRARRFLTAGAQAQARDRAVRPVADGSSSRLADLEAFLSPPGTAAGPLLASGVIKTFGGVRALDGAGLEALPGEVCALIGPNGSGKTTLLNVISGFYPATAGTVSFGDQVLSAGRSWFSARFGVARTFQTPMIPAGMTVLGVVASARYRLDYVGMLSSVLRLRRFRAARRRDERYALAALAFVGIEDLRDADAASLPLGLRRRVEVARAVAARPRILLLDEPASGLAEAEVAELMRLLQAIKRMGVITVLVEHNFEFVMSAADHVVVLDFGSVLAAGSPAEIRQNSAVRERYLGSGDVAAVTSARETLTGPAGPSGSPTTAEPLLVVSHLSSGYGDLKAVWDVDLEVALGQTTVLLGNNGAGKTTTLLAIAGLLPALSGEVRYEGRAFGRLASGRRIRAGIALVQEGKRIFPGLTVEQNLMVGGWTIQSRNRRLVTRRANEMFERFPALAAKRQHAAGSLSGGQQQILAIAQALMPGPRLLMLDEPSAGLAPTIMADVLAAIKGLNADGVGVLLVEQLVDTALAVADRVVVVSRGRTVLRAEGREGIGDGAAIRAAYAKFDDDGDEKADDQKVKVPPRG